MEGVAVVEGLQEVTLFTQMNIWAGSFMPGVIWDVLEAFLGLSLIIISFAQRTITPRFRKDKVRCKIDRVAVYLSHAGLVLLGTIGVVVLIDALTNPDRVPRVYAVLSMSAYLLIHGRVVLLSILELWPFNKTRWHDMYGAKAYYAEEYQALAKRSADQ